MGGGARAMQVKAIQSGRVASEVRASKAPRSSSSGNGRQRKVPKSEQRYHTLLDDERKRAKQERAQSSEKLIRAMEATIEAMALTVEMRDPYTAGHQRRVTKLAVAIAKELNLSEAEIDGIRTAGIVHDIGKIQIPAEILSKPGRLTELEFSLIKNHPSVGYEILKSVEFPWPVAQIVLQHHERMDGSGYPLGISGDDILLEARILSVADVVEAMASHRPYRPALGIGQALGEIWKNKGILYDSKVVDACFALFYEKDFSLD
jgi:putative nucleotidyltransferase with HDIG domain